MEWKELLGELVQMVQAASPKVWEIVIRQVYVNGLSRAIWSALSLLVGYGLYRLGKHYLKKHREVKKEHRYSSSEDWEFAAWLGFIFSAFTLFSGIALLLDAIGIFVNPEYHAIQLLVEFVK